jgi:two-component system chemotaxis response regulator CheY
MKNLSVLVVDDSLIAIKKMTQYLNQLDHRVVRIATTGVEALSAYEDALPDLVTMDITMPDMDGIEASRIILERHPNAIIVIASSHRQALLEQDALAMGVKAFISKPFEKNDLETVINQVFNAVS